MARRPHEASAAWFDAVIGYLSASIEWAKRSATPTPGSAGGAMTRPARTTSWAKTTSPFHSVIWPGILLGANGQGIGGRRALNVRDARPAHRDRQLRVPHHVGFETGVVAWARDLRARLLARLRPGRPALLHRGQRPREPGHRLHLGRVAVRRINFASPTSGATWSTARSRWRTRTWGRFRRPAS